MFFFTPAWAMATLDDLLSGVYTSRDAGFQIRFHLADAGGHLDGKINWSGQTHRLRAEFDGQSLIGVFRDAGQFFFFTMNMSGSDAFTVTFQGEEPMRFIRSPLPAFTGAYIGKFGRLVLTSLRYGVLEGTYRKSRAARAVPVRAAAHGLEAYLAGRGLDGGRIHYNPGENRYYVEIGDFAGPAARRTDDEVWQQAVKAGTEQALLAYAEDFPKGKHTGKIDSVVAKAFERAKKTGTLDAYIAFRNAYPGSHGGRSLATKYLGELDRLAWKSSRTSNTEMDSRKYLTAFPDGKYRAEAIAGLPYEVAWERTLYDGDKMDEARAVALAADGGYVIAGRNQDAVDGPRKLRSHVWVTKLDSRGNQQWSRGFGASHDDGLEDMAAAADGGFFLVSTVPTAADKKVISVVKLDRNGNRKWQDTFGGNWEGATASATVETPDGGFLVVGSIMMNKERGRDFLAAKYRSNGELQWARAYHKSLYDEANGAAISPGGGYLFTGSWKTESASYFKGWTVKIDGNGEEQWERAHDTYYTAIGNTKDGGYVLVGGRYPTVGARLKLNAAGETLWARAKGGSTIVPGHEGGFLIDQLRTDDQGRALWVHELSGPKFVYRVYDSVATPDGGYLLAGHRWTLDAKENSSVMWVRKIMPPSLR